ncbi:MAG: ribosome-associated translation inhibitor RaiA [Bacteroidales bacterium]|nr:ribosome-associated translation inhibitor RaiA [Bacteroidales bacterium]HPO66610.1 ribosome-associated translation inhibitor RaiA [Bacteroidales bacterium]
MNINIQSVHFDADRKLIEFTTKKVEKLEKFYDRIVGAKVIFRLDKSETDENKIAEIRIEIPGNDVFAKRQCKTFEEAVDQAVDALKTQLTKHKEKQRGE